MTSTTAPRRHRRTTRAALLLVAAVSALVASTGPATAHVSVQPDSVEGGGFAVVAFRVPNERDDAGTTGVRVILPADQPLASVQTTPLPGWRIDTEQRNLDEPVDLVGSEVSTVVSEVTWTATGAGVAPGQFQDFALSIGPLPDSGQLVFKAVQTYSSGERVAWNEVAVDESAEPERPAPVLTLSAPEEEPAAVGVADPEEASAAATTPAHDADAGAGTGAGAALPIGLSVVALLTALAALGVALKRRAG